MQLVTYRVGIGRCAARSVLPLVVEDVPESVKEEGAFTSISEEETGEIDDAKSADEDMEDEGEPKRDADRGECKL